MTNNERKLVEAAQAMVGVVRHCTHPNMVAMPVEMYSAEAALSKALAPYEPKQITIAGITFDAPLREEPELKSWVHAPNNAMPQLYDALLWCGLDSQRIRLKAGGYFATAEAAAACARAYAKLVEGEV
jgi:hypothetical protein